MEFSCVGGDRVLMTEAWRGQTGEIRKEVLRSALTGISGPSAASRTAADRARARAQLQSHRAPQASAWPNRHPSRSASKITFTPYPVGITVVYLHKLPVVCLAA